MTNKVFKEWMDRATMAQKKRLAKMTGSSVGSLRHLVSGHRKPSSEMAIRIEKATKKMLELPTVSRMDLNDTCRDCDYARFCVKYGVGDK